MAKYSYYCEKCGFTFQSDDKTEVAAVRQNHRRKKSITTRMPNGDVVLTGNHSCGLVRLGDGTATRVRLAGIITTVDK